MAYTTADFARTRSTGTVAAYFAALADRWSKWREFRRTVNELEALDDRSLADLGIGRGGVRRVALEAVYR